MSDSINTKHFKILAVIAVVCLVRLVCGGLTIYYNRGTSKELPLFPFKGFYEFWSMEY